MIYHKLNIPEVILIEPKVFGDDRGYFFESYRQSFFRENGVDVEFVQMNESKSARGVLRGLHYQLPPFAQSKLVRTITGSILDVAVDIRESSPTYGQHVVAELSGDNKHQLFIPQGFAHGFVVLSDEAIVSYMVDNYYAPEFDRGILWNDPELSIDWKLSKSEILLSEKDAVQPTLKSAECFSVMD